MAQHISARLQSLGSIISSAEWKVMKNLIANYCQTRSLTQKATGFDHVQNMRAIWHRAQRLLDLLRLPEHLALLLACENLMGLIAEDGIAVGLAGDAALIKQQIHIDRLALRLPFQIVFLPRQINETECQAEIGVRGDWWALTMMEKRTFSILLMCLHFCGLQNKLIG